MKTNVQLKGLLMLCVVIGVIIGNDPDENGNYSDSMTNRLVLSFTMKIIPFQNYFVIYE